jgi:hypothetical protein
MSEKIRVRGGFIRATKLNKDRDCIRDIGESEIELNVTEEDIREAIMNGWRNIKAISINESTSLIIKLLTGSMPMVEKEGNKERVGDESKLQSPDRFKTVNRAKEKSDCCNAPIKIGGDDKEGTHYYICTKCDKACDPKEEKRSCEKERTNFDIFMDVSELDDKAKEFMRKTCEKCRFRKQPPKEIDQPDWELLELNLSEEGDRNFGAEQVVSILKALYKKVYKGESR